MSDLVESTNQFDDSIKFAYFFKRGAELSKCPLRITRSHDIRDEHSKMLVRIRVRLCCGFMLCFNQNIILNCLFDHLEY